MKSAIGEKRVKVYCYFWDGTRDSADKLISAIRADLGIKIARYSGVTEVVGGVDTMTRLSLNVNASGYTTEMLPRQWITIQPGCDAHIKVQSEFEREFLSDTSVWKFPNSFIREALKEQL